MPVPQPQQPELWTLLHRRPRQRRKRHARWQAWLAAALALGGVLAALVALAQAWQYQALAQQVPAVEQLQRWVDPVEGLLMVPTRVDDRQGALVAYVQPQAAQSARYLPWNRLPRELQLAWRGVVQPQLWPQEEAFTVEEALARWLLAAEAGLPPSRAPEAQVRFLSQQLRQSYSQEQLWEWWLNVRPFGLGVNGLDALAWALFEKSAQEVEAEEAVWLALLARWPELEDPTSPKTRQRYRRLVQWLVTQGVTGLPQEPISTPDLARKAPPLHPSSIRRWWLHAWLERGPQPLPARGRRVLLSLDARLEQELLCLLRQAQSLPLPPACPNLPPWPEEPLPADLVLEVAVLDPATGQLLALLFPDTQPAPQPRPVGTALAPWLYAAAFTRGWSPATLLWDVPASLNPLWEPLENHDGRFHGPLQAGQALSNTYEVPLALLLDHFGLTGLTAMLDTLGWPMRPEELRTVPQGLGPQTTLPEILHRLGMFAALGQWSGWETPLGQLQPVLFTQAWRLDGTQETLPPPQRQLRLSPGLAYLITYSLSNPAWRQPPLPVTPLPETAALFLGRSEQGRVLWALGYSPHRVVGLVVDARRVLLPRERLERLAVLLWQQIFAWVHRDLSPARWPQPQEVVQVPVCLPSGLLPTEDCPQTALLPFLQAYTPTQADTLYRRFPINRQTGRLATVFTPPELIEERVYLVYPPEAEIWARENGLELPPTEYDPIRPAPPQSFAQIQHPLPFAYISGQVEVRGTAQVPEFAGYQLQVGRGLYPRRWQVVAGSDQPVQDGLLGVWDTTQHPPGLYVLQLQVVDREGKLFTHTIQVTIDATPPRLEVLSPREGTLVLTPAGRVFLHLEAEDDYLLAWVRVLDEGRELLRFTQGPFRALLPLTPGPHRLIIQAQDAAGNRTQLELQVTVP